MKILVIGAGNMAAGFVRHLCAAGHQVRIVSRTPGKARELASRHGAEAVAAAGAAAGQDVVILATRFADAAEALRSVGNLDGTVVVDISNPVTPDFMGLTLGHDTSAAEELARTAPGAQLVKAFNTLFAQVLEDGGDLGGGQKATVFLAGDSAAAKDRVRTLAEDMGFQTLDAGGLRNARYLEPVGGLNIYFGYGAGLGTRIAPAWIQGAR